MTRARDLANIISGGFTADDIPNLDASKITSGTFADARIAASNVSQHAQSFDDNEIVNDISTLAIRQASNENKAAYNTNSMYVDVFQDSTGITNLTNAVRNASEYVDTSQTDTDLVVTAFEMGSGNSSVISNGSNYTIDQSTGAITIPNFSETASESAGASVDRFGIKLDFGSEKTLTGSIGAELSNFRYGSGGSNYHTGFNHLIAKNASNSVVTPHPYSSVTKSGTQESSDGWYRWNNSDTNSNNDLTNNSELGHVVRGWYTGNSSNTKTIDGNFSGSITARYLEAVLVITHGHPSTFKFRHNGSAVVRGQTTSATGSFESNAITAPSSTSSMGAIITYQDNAGTNTLNTDIVLKLSADGGSNYSTATLTAMPDFATGIKMAKVNDLSVTAGTSLKYKIEFANQASGSKEARIRGVSLQY